MPMVIYRMSLVDGKSQVKYYPDRLLITK